LVQGIPLKIKFMYKSQSFLFLTLCTSHKGLLFSAQEAALRVPGLLRATHRSRSFTPPSNENSVFANGTPDPHHAIFPGHPASVADVHHRLPSNFSIDVEMCTQPANYKNFYHLLSQLQPRGTSVLLGSQCLPVAFLSSSKTRWMY
jgi:hypothetical protein